MVKGKYINGYVVAHMPPFGIGVYEFTPPSFWGSQRAGLKMVKVVHKTRPTYHILRRIMEVRDGRQV